MLSHLHLKNFRGFEDHSLSFRNRTIVVGANNAGKSTIVEALRLIAIVTSRYRNLRYVAPPEWLDEFGAHIGVEPSVANLEINFHNIFHRYGDPPATISASFTNGSKIKVFIGPDRFCMACLTDEHGQAIINQARARRASIPSVAIMPQIGPIRPREVVLDPDYVRRAAYSNISSLHFRNQICISKDILPQLQAAVSATWPGVRIEELIEPHPMGEQIFHLQIRNGDFVGEVATMGHGLQMWLQTMWFICKAQGDTTLILDEPDVYMHADMQRRLIRFVRDQFPQIILTTHSAEIMSEVDACDILIVDRGLPTSRFASNLPAVQTLLDRIGSAQNIHLARIWNARRLILVEGKDIKFLKSIQNLIFPDSPIPIDSIPNMAIGGWGGWSYAIGSDMLMRNAIGDEITTYCILDSDYHTKEEIQQRIEQARTRGVNLHIWTSKEIENFFLIPSVIQRYISEKSGRRTAAPTIEEVRSKIEIFANDMEDTVFDAFSTEYLSLNRSGGLRPANQLARARIREARDRYDSIRNIVSGKDLFSRLAGWSQDEFGVGFNSLQILSSMHPSEVPQELRSLIDCIEHTTSFASTQTWSQ